VNLTWGQLLTSDMTPELAGLLMGVSTGIAEMELQRAAAEMPDGERVADVVGLFLQSRFPTRDPRKIPRMDDLPSRLQPRNVRAKRDRRPAARQALMRCS